MERVPLNSLTLTLTRHMDSLKTKLHLPSITSCLILSKGYFLLYWLGGLPLVWCPPIASKPLQSHGGGRKEMQSFGFFWVLPEPLPGVWLQPVLPAICLVGGTECGLRLKEFSICLNLLGNNFSFSELPSFLGGGSKTSALPGVLTLLSNEFAHEYIVCNF